MFLRKQLLSDGTIRETAGWNDPQTGEEHITFSGPENVTKTEPIIARIEVQCNENEEGVLGAQALAKIVVDDLSKQMSEQRYRP